MDLDLLLKLRLIVARFGEMDIAKWWNTRGQLGPLGASALRRGFPRSHYFAQARAVFAVAGQRCTEVFDPPSSVTLWRLPERIEEEFRTRWEYWLDNSSDWTPFFKQIEQPAGLDLAAHIRALGIVTDNAVKEAARVRWQAGHPAVALTGSFGGTDHDIALLALTFARGGVGALAVPYMRLDAK